MLSCLGRLLVLGGLPFVFLPAVAMEGGNALLVPTTEHCIFSAHPEELQQTIDLCRRHAEAGDIQSQFELGELYYRGERVPQDLKAALNWFEQASLQGHAEAQFRLGNMFFHGEGVQANTVQAYIILKMAAVNGAEDAMDVADQVADNMSEKELDIATQILGKILRNYLNELQNAENMPFAPFP